VVSSIESLFVLQAVGEPPLFLAASVFFAIQDAVNAARKDAGETEPLLMDSPATCERIRMACSDHLIKLVIQLFVSVYVCGIYTLIL